ncbi:MAG: hypothetical protein WA996_13085, partial [Candidatus Promineifilaceae bacterium]
IEEAARPENARRLFIAVLTQISPAELVRYFAMPGLRFWPEHLLHQGSGLVTELIPYPPNFRLLGTMDTARFKWQDKDIHTHTAVLQWSGISVKSNNQSSEPLSTVNHEEVFLRACVRSTGIAYAKLYRILQELNQPFLPLMQVLDLLRKYDVIPPRPVIEQTIVFLANAWTTNGVGLFDDSPRGNLNTALDLAMAQYVLSWMEATHQRPQVLRQHLRQLLEVQFDHASDALNAWV